MSEAGKTVAAVQRLSTVDFKALTKEGATSVQLVHPGNAPDARVTITRVTLDRGAAQARHSHPGSEQTWIVESGTATMLCEGADIAIGPGDVLRTPPGTVHGLVNSGDEPFVYLTITAPPQDFAAYYDPRSSP